jgi:hypothetical protein
VIFACREGKKKVLLVSRGEQEALRRELQQDEKALTAQLNQLEKEAKDWKSFCSACNQR